MAANTPSPTSSSRQDFAATTRACRRGGKGSKALRALTKHPLDVVAIIRQTATLRGIQGLDRERLDGAVEYLRKNSVYIHYAQFLQQGLPIATGVIEGAPTDL